MMEYRNAKRLSNGRIECEINHPAYGWLPFLCDPKDTGAEFDTAALHASMEADPATAPYVPPTQAVLDARAADDVRMWRNQLLQTDVDPVVSNPLRWADLTADQQAQWASYRRALLDITEQIGFPHSILWPEKPL